MRVTIHVDAKNRQEALKTLRAATGLLRELSDDGTINWRSPKDRSAITAAPSGRHPDQPPEYEVLGLTEDGRAVLVTYYRHSMEDIVKLSQDAPTGKDIVMGYWRERDGTRHDSLKSWTQLPFG